MKKEEIHAYILGAYGVEADYPFADGLDTASFRNPRNQKWFALLIGKVSGKCLGLGWEEAVQVLNLKCDPLLIPSLMDHQKIFPAYHMNKEHWISLLLNSPITQEEMIFLVDMSYQLVDRAGRTTNGRKASMKTKKRFIDETISIE